MSDETTWTELAIHLISIEDAAHVKGVSAKTAKRKLSLSRTNLLKHGWQVVKEERDEVTVIVAMLPPSGYTVDEWLACHLQMYRHTHSLDHTREIRPEQMQHWQDKEAQTGRPVLTWREMAILGWGPAKAMEHRGTLNYRKSVQSLQEARNKLRAEGWSVSNKPNKGKPIPPTQSDQTPNYIREIAAAQQRSNWLLRLPASAK